MLRPDAEKPARQNNEPLTEEEKDEARSRIFARLKVHGRPIEGTWDEIRTKLDLNDIKMRLFQSSCWHLREMSFIRVSRGESEGITAKRSYIISAL